jgi:pyroglutamyl-peptidase
MATLLLTSFETWLPHQKSNSSDDLLNELIDRNLLPENCYLLRKLPVNFDLAPYQVITKIKELQPDVILCCGMAESRPLLTVESNGKSEQDIVFTPLPLRKLMQGLQATEISHDAGKFVCNALYYSVLKFMQVHQLPSHCLFVHVPVLQTENREAIVHDFLQLTQKIALI